MEPDPFLKNADHRGVAIDARHSIGRVPLPDWRGIGAEVQEQTDNLRRAPSARGMMQDRSAVHRLSARMGFDRLIRIDAILQEQAHRHDVIEVQRAKYCIRAACRHAKAHQQPQTVMVAKLSRMIEALAIVGLAPCSSSHSARGRLLAWPRAP